MCHSDESPSPRWWWGVMLGLLVLLVISVTPGQARRGGHHGGGHRQGGHHWQGGHHRRAVIIGRAATIGMVVIGMATGMGTGMGQASFSDQVSCLTRPGDLTGAPTGDRIVTPHMSTHRPHTSMSSPLPRHQASPRLPRPPGITAMTRRAITRMSSSALAAGAR